MLSNLNFAVILITLLLAGAQVQAAVLTFSDDTFDDNDWTLIDIDSDSGSASGGQATVSKAGNSSNLARQFTHNIPGGHNLVAVFHRMDNATFNPATQGTINALNYQFDYRKITSSSDSNTVVYYIGLMQDGVVYDADYEASSNTSWTTKDSASPLTAASFEVYGTNAGSPDFSTAGSPISFGYITANSSTSSNYSTTHAVDDYELTLDYQAIPEPASLLLLVSGAVVMLRGRVVEPKRKG